MLTITPDLFKIRNDVFKQIIIGLHATQPVATIANNIVDGLSNSMVLIDEPTERRKTVKEMYKHLEEVETLRQFNFNYQSPEINKTVTLVANEVLFKFRLKYAKYF